MIISLRTPSRQSLGYEPVAILTPRPSEINPKFPELLTDPKLVPLK